MTDKENKISILEKRIRELEAENNRFRKIKKLISDHPGSFFQFTVKADGSYDTPFLSEENYDLTGLPRDKELKFSEIIELVHPEDKSRVRNSIEKAVAVKAKWDMNFRIIRKDGEIRWINGIAMPGENSNEFPVWDGIFYDITEQKNTIDRLTAQDLKYRELFDNVNDAIFLNYFDDHGDPSGIFEVNETAVRLTGYTKKELLEKKLNDLLVSEPVNEKNNSILTKIDTEAESIFNVVIKHKSGKLIPVEVSSHVFYSGEEKIAINAVRDRSERIEFEKAVKENEKKYRTLFESSVDGIMLMKDLVFIDCNQAAAEIYGCTKEDLIGKTPLDFSPEYQNEKTKSADIAKEYIKRAISGEIMIFTWKHHKLNGEPFDSEISLTPMTLNDEQYVLAIARDVTERIKVQKALMESEKKYRMVVDNAEEAIVILQDGKIKFANPRLFELLDYSENEIYTSGFEKFIYPEDRAEAFERYKRRIKGEKFTPQSTFRIIDINGNLRWISNNAIQISWQGEKATLNFLSDITERKIAEEELKISEKKFRNIVESTPMGIHQFEMDDNGDLIFIGGNKAVTKILDFDHKDILFKPILEAFPGLKGSDVPDIYRDIAMNGGVWYKEQVDYDTDEIKGAFEVHAFQTSPGRVSVMFNDISDRIEAEKELRRWASTFQNAQWGIVVNSPDGKTIQLVNPAFAKMHGYKEKELIGEPVAKLLSPESAKKLDHYISVSNEKGFNTFEIEHRRKNGEIFPVQINVTVVRNDARNIRYRVLNVIDITEKKQAEEALKIRDAAIESAIQPIGMADPEGKMTYVNKAFLDLWGYPKKDEVIGRDFREFGKIDEMEDILKQVRESGGMTGEIKGFKNDGSEFDLQYSINFVNDKFGNPVQLMGSFIDITDKKKSREEIQQLNAELRELNELLEEKVIERTSELNEALEKLETRNIELEELNIKVAQDADRLLRLNEELFDSEQKLKESNATKDKFFSIIAHDLINPMQSLMLSSELLMRFCNTYDKEKIADKAMKINAAVNQLHNLLENLLTWARAQSGRIDFMPEKLDIADIVENTVEIFHGQIESKNIEMEIDIPSDSEIIFDENMIRTVLRNLISNAVKFTGERGKVGISMENSGDDTYINISDTGIGMSPEDQVKLFRIDVANREIGSSGEKGTGLGLIICKEFVEKHNGTILVESSPGEGSVFSIKIPGQL